MPCPLSPYSPIKSLIPEGEFDYLDTGKLPAKKLFEDSSDEDSEDKVSDVVKTVLDSHVTPKKTKVDEDLRVLFSPDSKNAKNVIYIFKNIITGERYVGKTMQTLGKRVSGHMSNARCEDKDRGKTPLPTAIRENPENFEIGILYKAPPGNEHLLDEMETAFINYYDAVNTGYNSNCGGGGGYAKTAEISDKLVKKILKETFNEFVSPKKKNIKKTKTGFAVQLSPHSKKLRNVIYVFKNIKTEERYVGKTMQEAAKRMYSHMSNVKCKDKDRGRTPLAEAVRANYKDFEVGILYEAPPGQEGVLDAMEKAFIEYYDAVNAGYNCNEGGGGSYSSL